MSTKPSYRTIDPFRRFAPLVGLALGGPAATVYSLQINPAMLSQQNIFAFGHVMIGLVTGMIMLIGSKKGYETKVMVTAGVVFLGIGAMFFWLEYSPELWRSLAITALLSWLLRWAYFNQRLIERLVDRELKELKALNDEFRQYLPQSELEEPDTTGVDVIIGDPAPTSV